MVARVLCSATLSHLSHGSYGDGSFYKHELEYSMDASIKEKELPSTKSDNTKKNDNDCTAATDQKVVKKKKKK